MPIIARYELRVEGVLKGPRTADTDQIMRDFISTIRPSPHKGLGGSGSKQGWPDGFVLKGYRPYIWHFDVLELPAEETQPKKDRTLLTFHAEVASHLPVELDSNLYPRDELEDFRRLSDLSDDRLTKIPGRAHGPVHPIATEHHEWFLAHCDQQWCRELVAKLDKLNDTLDEKDMLRERFRMRRMHWYLGDGS